MASVMMRRLGGGGNPLVHVDSTPPPLQLQLPPSPRTPPARWFRIKRILQKVVSIRVLIVILVVLLVVAAGLLAWLVQYYLVRSGIDDMSNSVRYIVRTGVNFQTTAVLNAGTYVSKIDNGTFAYNIENTSLAVRQAYFKHLYRLLQSSKSIGSMSYSSITGDSVGCRRVSPYDPLAPYAHGNFTYYTQFAGDPDLTLYSYDVEPVTINVGPLISTTMGVNPLTRPWFQAGLASYDEVYVWSDIYVSAQNQLTVSVAQPFFDDDTREIVGVLGVHLFISRIKGSLLNLTAYGGSEIVFVNDTGHLVLDSCPMNTYYAITCPRLISDPLHPYFLYQSGGVYAQINNDVISEFGSWSNVIDGRTVDLGDYWVTYQNIYDRNLHWVAVIIIDSDVYLSQVERANTGTVIGLIVFTVIAAVLAVIAGIAITRPLSRTISQMDRISKMDFTKLRARRRSKMYEIMTLEKSLSRLRAALTSFEKFVPSRVVKEFLSQDMEAHLGVAPLFATVFFCDIEDFTTIAEVMDPTHLVDLLLDFLQEMSNVILEESHGTIDKFIGDAIMAFWNAPHPVENHAEMACFAAMRCHKKIMYDLRPKWANMGILPEGLQLNARFGIHTGDMLVGNIGSLERINYTAIGDNVNVASRLEALCKFYQVRILISAATYELVKERFLCRPIDMVVVKGKSQSLLLYELMCERVEAYAIQIKLCGLLEQAISFMYVNPDPERALAMYEDLHAAYPEDVSIGRVRDRLRRLAGTDQWPGAEVFDHK